MFKLVEAAPPWPRELVGEVRRLFQEYASSLHLDLEFQGFARELEELPGEYAPPRGRLFLAWASVVPAVASSVSAVASSVSTVASSVTAAASSSPAAGCIALRPLSDEICEMKRLYVRPEYRGLGLGRLLSLRLMEEAAAIGYRRMRLDTLASMAAATGLYRSLGFREIPAYCHNPLPEPLFFEKELGP